jgi:hypothetical protein
LILKVTTRFIFPVLILVAIFLLLRGHHEPGGGFIAGLVIACAVVLVLLAWDLKMASETVRIDPLHYVAIGLESSRFYLENPFLRENGLNSSLECSPRSSLVPLFFLTWESFLLFLGLP